MTSRGNEFLRKEASLLPARTDRPDVCFPSWHQKADGLHPSKTETPTEARRAPSSLDLISCRPYNTRLKWGENNVTKQLIFAPAKLVSGS
jgi:hypothetical protein